MESERPGRASQEQRARGFSLIELITVIGILGILAAIAIQVIGRYREQAYDARAMHDLANAVNAEEAYYATFQSYVTFSAIGPSNVSVPGVVVSGTVALDMTGGTDSFEGTAVSTSGTGKVFRYDSITDTFVNQ